MLFSARHFLPFAKIDELVDIVLNSLFHGVILLSDVLVDDDGVFTSVCELKTDAFAIGFKLAIGKSYEACTDWLARRQIKSHVTMGDVIGEQDGMLRQSIVKHDIFETFKLLDIPN